MNTESAYNEFTDTEKEKYKKWLQDILQTNSIILTFTKKDGTIREMKCTLQESKIPKVEKTTASNRRLNNEILSIFDLEKQGWRSCRYDSIKEIKFTLGD